MNEQSEYFNAHLDISEIIVEKRLAEEIFGKTGSLRLQWHKWQVSRTNQKILRKLHLYSEGTAQRNRLPRVGRFSDGRTGAAGSPSQPGESG